MMVSKRVVLGMAVTFLSIAGAQAAQPNRLYPREFLWGVAFSAHQTEGKSGGGENSDWYDFEHGKSHPIADGDTADVGTDHWNRYEEDLKLAQSLGMQTLRTSVAWEKIEPRPGEFDAEVLAHYRAEFQRMRELGLRPMIALHHFVNPRWFVKAGGWTSRESPRLFLRYAEKVVQELGDLCDLWITFNEPVVFTTLGFAEGVFPPNRHNLFATYEATWNLARAHRMVAAMIHRVQGPSPSARGADGALRGVGLANSTQFYEPYRKDNRDDQVAAAFFEDISSWAFLRAIETGRLTIHFPKGYLIPGFDRAFPEDDIEEGPATAAAGPFQDWIGINYYNHFYIQRKRLSLLGVKWIVPPEDELSDNGWAIHAAGLEHVLRKAAEFGRPLVVTENGIADANDSKRPRFIRDHLAVLDRALFGSDQGPGLDIRGYYHWSLTDNFEWVHGYRFRFGLIGIDYGNGLKRVPRASAELYSAESRRRGRGNGP